MEEKRETQSTLQGIIGRITYQNPESHYTVARLDLDGSPAVTVVGEIFPVTEGEEIKVSGRWKVHPRYGLQFHAENWQKLEPVTFEGIERYLGSGLIKGLGPTYARRLVAAFGVDTLNVLSNEPQRILEIEGIGKIRAQRILKAWQEQRGMQEVMVFLQGHGVGSALAVKIYRAYGADSIARIKENPYCLAREIYGVGFLLADRIAAKIGISGDFPLRVQAGVLHLLREISDAGHCFAPLPLLEKKASGLLGVAEESVERAIERLVGAGDVVLEENGQEKTPKVYLSELYHAECRAAATLRRLLSSPSRLSDKGFKGPRDQGGKPFEDLFNPSTFSLEEEQIEAVREALKQKVLVITGGPGTGKTTLLNFLLTILRQRKASFVLAAPTGRAAKRMGETTGEEAATIHRLLEYNPRDGSFQRAEHHPIEADVVIIDEASMVDLALMDHLLRAVDPRSHLILLGDVDQLPSVGPGSVLRDLIESQVVPVVVLRHIFRQSRGSLIVQNAHRILQGQALILGDEKQRGDFVFIPRDDEGEILDSVKELVKERISRWLPLSSLEAVQVLSPMHRGLLGTIHLNRELQKLLNPVGESIERGDTVFRLGDKVMQLRNNYDKGVFNGDLGRIVRVDREQGEMEVEFYGKRGAYEAENFDELSLAYATSVHKSQGSEYSAVVMPLHTSHYVMLHRSILYTAVTRGKELVVLVGSRKALAMAIKNFREEKRYTGLREKLLAV